MQQGQDEINLIAYWQIIVRRRWTVYLAVAAGFLVALIGSFTATPQYRGTTTVQIERRTPDILTQRDLSQIDHAWPAYTDFYQTQYKIIESEPVARRAAELLDLSSHPRFETSSKRSRIMGRIRSLIPRKAPATESSALDRATAGVIAGMEIAPIRSSHLVKISWISADSDLASAVANALAEAYIQVNMESQFSASEQAEVFLVNQIGKVKQEIAEIEARLQTYGESKRIVSIDDSNNLRLQALKNVSEHRTEAQTRLATAEAAHESIAGIEHAAVPEVMNSSLISRLRQEHAALETEISEMTLQFGEDWPKLQTLRRKLEQARIHLDEETQLIVNQARASSKAEFLEALSEVRNLNALLTDQEAAAQVVKRDSVEYANLSSEAMNKRATLDALITRQNEMALSTRLQDFSTTSSNVRIVNRATPPRSPFRPNTRMNVLLGIALGLLIGIGMAVLLDHLDNTIGSVEEVRILTELPMLAVIPRHGEGGSPFARVRRRQNVRDDETLDLVAHRDTKTSTAEAYRDLRTALLLSHAGQPPRSILVTSAAPEDGKTATTINLAVVLAQLGARVLLVDADLRRPRIHKAFGIENRRGISNALSGLESDATRLTVSSGIDNLDLLLSGPIPPNPSELLNSPTFVQICQQFREQGYDHIVFDSPPVVSVSDSIIIANVVDSCILVVRAARTPKQSVRLAVDRLRQATVRSLGVVLNDLDPDGPGASHYGYSYYGHHSDIGEGDTGLNKPGGAAGTG